MEKLSKELISALSAGLPERVSEKDLEYGVNSADDIVALVRNQQYERSPYIGDDFVPDTLGYNAVGAIYPSLPHEKRAEVVNVFLSKFDWINYLYVQNNHTSFIREPLLLADIIVARPLYWCGLDEGKFLLEKHKTFSDFKKNLIDSDGLFAGDKVHSDFLVGYAVLRNDMSSFSEDYAYTVHPQFLDRLVEGIVAMRIGVFGKESDLRDGRARLRDLLPAGLQDLVDKKYSRRQK